MHTQQPPVFDRVCCGSGVVVEKLILPNKQRSYFNFEIVLQNERRIPSSEGPFIPPIDKVEMRVSGSLVAIFNKLFPAKLYSDKLLMEAEGSLSVSNLHVAHEI